MNIVVICGMSDEKVRARLQPLIKIDEINTIYLVRRKPLILNNVITYSTPGWMQNFLFLAEIYRVFTLLFLCLTKRPDVFYGIYFVPHGIYASVAGKIFRKPVIQELIGTDRPKVLGSKLLFGLLKSAKRISVRGNTSKEQLIKYGIPSDKIFISPAVNVLNFEHFNPNNRVKIFDLIYCGRLDKNKQIDNLIKAISTLKNSYPDLKLVIVGDGPERSYLEHLSQELGLEINITFVGSQPYEKIPYYLNQAKIFVMSSAFEGLPVAMLEALSCGLPLVVPNVGDIPDLAQHGVNALLLEKPGVDAYANALDQLLTNDLLYHQLSQGVLKTRQQMLEEFTIEKATENFRQVLSEVTG